VNPIRDRWDWAAVDHWMRAADESKQLMDQQRFDALELRLYKSVTAASGAPGRLRSSRAFTSRWSQVARASIPDYRSTDNE
jgi:hypothetical protein